MKKFLALFLLSCLLLPCLNSCLNADGLTPETTPGSETTASVPSDDATEPDGQETTSKSEDETTAKSEEITTENTEEIAPPADPFAPYEGSYSSFIWSRCVCELSLEEEIEPWMQSTEKADLVKTSKVIDVFGKEFTAEYVHSEVPLYYATELDLYQTDDFTRIYLDAETGKIRKFSCSGDSYESGKENVIFSEKEAEDFAKGIASLYVENVDAYTITVQTSPSSAEAEETDPHDFRIYRFHFNRYINGIWCPDYLTMEVTSKGNVIALTVGEVGAFDDLDIEFDEAELQHCITYHLVQAYGAREDAYKDRTLDSVTVEETRTVLAPDGKVYVSTAVKVVLKNADGKTSTCLQALITDIGVSLNVN